MNNTVSNIIFLIDKSGSMNRIKSDVVGGFNSFLEEQKKLNLPMKFWLTLFDTDSIEKRYVDVNLDDIKELNDDTYYPNGMTNLYDAIGETLEELSHIKEALFVIFTDGQENASRKYNQVQIKKMIEEKEQTGYHFLYLGVDFKDYDKEASNIGISANLNVTGSNMNTYSAVANTVSNYRKSFSKSTFNVKDDYSNELNTLNNKKDN